MARARIPLWYAFLHGRGGLFQVRESVLRGPLLGQRAPGGWVGRGGAGGLGGARGGGGGGPPPGG
ncbi:MAG: hypothetical protein C4300_03690, partial [Thermus sp.]